MNATGTAHDISRRVLLGAFAGTLALGLTFGITGCDKAEDAIEQQQQEEAEQFEQDVENSAGGASDAQDAVDAMNEQIGTTEEAQDQ